MGAAAVCAWGDGSLFLAEVRGDLKHRLALTFSLSHVECGVEVSGFLERGMNMEPGYLSSWPHSTATCTSTFFGLLRLSTRNSRGYTQPNGQTPSGPHIQQLTGWHRQALQHAPRPKEAAVWLQAARLVVDAGVYLVTDD